VKASEKNGIMKGSKKTYLKVKKNLGHPQMGLSQKLGCKTILEKFTQKVISFRCMCTGGQNF
jgi:hypothetical protein